MATFTNQATLRYNGNVVNSNITTGELVEVLSATKTAVINNYSQGSDITYVINIVNSGAVAFTGLSVTDNLGAYTLGMSTLVPLDYVAGSAQYYLNGVAFGDIATHNNSFQLLFFLLRLLYLQLNFHLLLQINIEQHNLHIHQSLARPSYQHR